MFDGSIDCESSARLRSTASVVESLMPSTESSPSRDAPVTDGLPALAARARLGGHALEREQRAGRSDQRRQRRADVDGADPRDGEHAAPGQRREVERGQRGQRQRDRQLAEPGGGAGDLGERVGAGEGRAREERAAGDGERRGRQRAAGFLSAAHAAAPRLAVMGSAAGAVATVTRSALASHWKEAALRAGKRRAGASMDVPMASGRKRCMARLLVRRQGTGAPVHGLVVEFCGYG